MDAVSKSSKILIAAIIVAVLAICGFFVFSYFQTNSKANAETTNQLSDLNVVATEFSFEASNERVVFEDLGDEGVVATVSVDIKNTGNTELSSIFEIKFNLLDNSLKNTVVSGTVPLNSTLDVDKTTTVNFQKLLTRDEFDKITAMSIEKTSENVKFRYDASISKQMDIIDKAKQEMAKNVAANEEAKKKAAEEAAKLAFEEEQAKNKSKKEFASDYSDTILIGDSISSISSTQCNILMPALRIDADGSRSLEKGGINENYNDADGVLDHVRADTGLYERYIIETGNNDSSGMSVEQAEEIINTLGADKEIYFITELVTDNTTSTANTNATIDEVVNKYQNVHKIDWYSLASKNADTYLADNCHPSTPDGVKAYANLIKESLDAEI